ncbi:MAG: hypothetical protein HDT23_01315 [Ruminococcus sp.]|nr:hypothetical protein [Ruminococcus sp.]
MANPIFNMMNKNTRPNMQTMFQQFMGQMKGKNPDEVLNNLVSSGKICQAQLNQAQAQAQQIQSQFDGMKNMFGF